MVLVWLYEVVERLKKGGLVFRKMERVKGDGRCLRSCV